MKGILTTVSLLALLGLAGCGGGTGPGTAASPGERPSGGKVAAQATPQKQQAVEAAKKRLAEIRSEVSGLRSNAGPVWSAIDASLQGSISDAAKRADAVDPEIAALEAAGPEAWASKSASVTSSLDDLKARVDRAAASLEAQKRVLDARRERERAPATGVVDGLDGVPYEAYRPSVVRDVQQALEHDGLYPGPADGVLGKPTMEALVRFQKTHDLAPSGVPTPRTRETLLRSEG